MDVTADDVFNTAQLEKMSQAECSGYSNNTTVDLTSTIECSGYSNNTTVDLTSTIDSSASGNLTTENVSVDITMTDISAEQSPSVLCNAPNPKRFKSCISAEERSRRCDSPVFNTDSRRRGVHESKPALHEAHSGRYLDFCRELNMPSSKSLRLVFLRSFRGVTYVGIRNIAPESKYQTVVKPCTNSQEEKPKGVFLTLPVWARLCSPEIINWVEAAITDSVNNSGVHDAQICGPDLVHIPGAFTTDNGEHRAPIGQNKWVTVQVFQNMLYVGFREFYFSKFCRKTLPGRGINLNFFEWEALLMYMPEVNNFISTL